jgi:glycogen synthase
MNRPFPLTPHRVLMTADTVGGVWNYSLELCRALGASGVQVLLATMGGTPGPDQRDQAARLRNVELAESRFKLEWMSDPWAGVDRAGEWLLELEQQFSPDVVHLNGYAHGALPFQAPKVVVAHSCVLSWWRAVKGCEAPPEWTEYSRRVRAGLRAADLVVAPTHAMLDALRRHYDPLPKAQVISNGRDPKRFARRQKEQLVLGAGRLWDEAKNLSALAAIAPRIPWSVVLAGERAGPNGAEVDLENVTLVGHLPERDLASLYGRAAIYVFPARYEPFGLSVLEAALSGCALVLGDIPSLRELWHNAALFVPPSDQAALRKNVVRLIDYATDRRHLAAIARSLATRMNPQRIAKDYLSAYTQVMTAQATQGRESDPTAAALDKHPA